MDNCWNDYGEETAHRGPCLSFYTARGFVGARAAGYAPTIGCSVQIVLPDRP